MKESIRKFMALDPKKRDKIINAAMKEFRYGYKKASTDVIVREAGISKGLLFHYFGTKEQLYEFLITHTQQIMLEGYLNMLDVNQQDFLDALWQSALLKRDIVDKYPYVYEFSEGAHAHRADMPSALFDVLIQKGEVVFEKVINKCDTTLIRDDIDTAKAIDMIFWTIESYVDYKNTKGITDYENFLEELRDYIDILRVCFYKQQ